MKTSKCEECKSTNPTNFIKVVGKELELCDECIWKLEDLLDENFPNPHREVREFEACEKERKPFSP